MIPKIIHYCWFGNNKKSKLMNTCINSWKKFFPDYEIIEWNENNVDVNENKYVKEAYKNKQWAYVSDYVRMNVLYQYGGIYFDVDVKVIKKFPQEILNLESFTGIESCSRLVSPGLVYACNKMDSIIGELLESYRKDVFVFDTPEDMITINKRITAILDRYGYVHEDRKQLVNGLTIFPSEFFCGYDGEKRCTCISENTLSVHYYAGTWLPWYRKIRKAVGTLIRHIKYSVWTTK